jgi:hypothetical protein
LPNWLILPSALAVCFGLGMLLYRQPKRKSNSSRIAKYRLMTITARDRYKLYDPRVSWLWSN